MSRQVIGWNTNCAINECTGDGTHVGRCWYTLERVGDAFICERHGNVTEVQQRFAETGRLTSELAHDPELAQAVARNKT